MFLKLKPDTHIYVQWTILSLLHQTRRKNPLVYKINSALFTISKPNNIDISCSLFTFNKINVMVSVLWFAIIFLWFYLLSIEVTCQVNIRYVSSFVIQRCVVWFIIVDKWLTKLNFVVSLYTELTI